MALFCFFFLFLSISSAQSLLDIAAVHPELGLFFSYVTASSSLQKQFQAADNFTLLAPTNSAVTTWLATLPSPSLIDATAQYHLLQGTHAAASLNANGTLLLSDLNDPTFVNITQGQSVKAYGNGSLFVESWLKAKSNLISTDIVVDGGLVHIIDTVLSIPQGAFEALPLANISLGVSLLSTGNFLSAKNAPFINAIGYHANLTILIPNSTLAEANFQPQGRNQTSLNRQLAYHCIDDLIYANGFVNGMQLPTIAGPMVKITKDVNGQVFVNDAKVIGSDYLVNNGVMHVLDDILNPDNITAPTSSAQRATALPAGSIVGIVIGALFLVALIAGITYLLVCHRRRCSSSEASNTLSTEERSIPTNEIPPKSKDDDWSSNIDIKAMELEELESPDSYNSVKDWDWKGEKRKRKTQLVEADAEREPVEMFAEIPSTYFTKETEKEMV